MSKVKKLGEHLEEHDEAFRIERYFTPELDKTKKLVDQNGDDVLDSDGNQMHPILLDKDGNGVFLWGVYERVWTGAENERVNKTNEIVKSIKKGKHPVIVQEGKPLETTHEWVWVKRFAGLEAPARDKLKQLLSKR